MSNILLPFASNHSLIRSSISGYLLLPISISLCLLDRKQSSCSKFLAYVGFGMVVWRKRIRTILRNFSASSMEQPPWPKACHFCNPLRPKLEMPYLILLINGWHSPQLHACCHGRVQEDMEQSIFVAVVISNSFQYYRYRSDTNSLCPKRTSARLALDAPGLSFRFR
jgi:hypothetical protein